jgi:hypothetical protein
MVFANKLEGDFFIPEPNVCCARKEVMNWSAFERVHKKGGMRMKKLAVFLVVVSMALTATLANALTIDVVDATGGSPGGYLPLSLFGLAPVTGFDDEDIINFVVTPFEYAGETWDEVGAVSNGYLVVGGGDGGDVDYINQSFPDTTSPNNVLAPFWTDLNPGAGGAFRIGYLTNGVDTWLVSDWEAVPNYGDGEPNSFQVWIGVNGVEDVWFTYGAISDGDGGYLTIGAEDKTGTVGFNYYFDGTGTPVTSGTELSVVTSGAPVPEPVPEPATMLLLGSGMLGLAGLRRRFRKS